MGGGEARALKGSFSFLEPKSTGCLGPYAGETVLEAKHPPLQVAGSAPVGGLIPTLGVGVGLILLRGPFLQEECVATRWQWYHPR